MLFVLTLVGANVLETEEEEEEEEAENLPKVGGKDRGGRTEGELPGIFSPSGGSSGGSFLFGREL